MPAPKSSSSSSRSGGSARKPAAAKRTSAKSTTAKKSSSKTTARKPAGKTAATKAAATKPATRTTTASTGAAKSTNLLNPVDLVVLTRDRIQEVLDDAVERGRMTRKDANDLVEKLFKRGRRQTEELMAELERRLGQGRRQIASATRKARRTEPVDRIVRQADRARRTVGVGPSFPILGYDDLSAGQVTGRIGELKPADLRKVRDYERKHANRKSVLDAVEKALA
jgi:polyhydroxyalkanoate synthesis regulator phasin